MNSAATIEGMPLRMSTVKLTARATLVPRAYSISRIAPRTPIGTAIAAQIRPISIVPTMAWYAPPPSRRGVMPRWLCSHQSELVTSAMPLVITV